MSKSLLASVDEVIRLIELLDVSIEAPRLANNLKEVGNTFIVENPDFAEIYAFLQFLSISSIPNLTRRMTDFIEARSGTLAERCALMFVLWYIGNPNDVLPDTYRGAIGFLDDAAVLNYVAGEYLLSILKPEGITKEMLENEFNVVTYGIPKNLIESLEFNIRVVSDFVQCQIENPEVVTEHGFQNMINNPSMIAAMVESHLNRLQRSETDTRTKLSVKPEEPRVSISKGGDSVYRDPSGHISVSYAGGGGIAMTEGGNILMWD